MLTLKQLRLSVLNEVHTNSYTGPRLYVNDLISGGQNVEETFKLYGKCKGPRGNYYYLKIFIHGTLSLS